MDPISEITAVALERMMNEVPPDYSSQTSGYILVNTLPSEEFEKEHIPNSINVPLSSLDLLKRAFDTSKPIIVYCASRSCSSSEKAARELQKLGFENVTDFSGGMREWKEQGGEIVDGMSQPIVPSADRF